MYDPELVLIYLHINNIVQTIINSRIALFIETYFCPGSHAKQ